MECHVDAINNVVTGNNDDDDSTSGDQPIDDEANHCYGHVRSIPRVVKLMGGTRAQRLGCPCQRRSSS